MNPNDTLQTLKIRIGLQAQVEGAFGRKHGIWPKFQTKRRNCYDHPLPGVSLEQQMLPLSIT